VEFAGLDNPKGVHTRVAGLRPGGIPVLKGVFIQLDQLFARQRAHVICSVEGSCNKLIFGCYILENL